eukprot:4460998-Amphidinium_carterae.1
MDVDKEEHHLVVRAIANEGLIPEGFRPGSSQSCRDVGSKADNIETLLIPATAAAFECETISEQANPTELSEFGRTSPCCHRSARNEGTPLRSIPWRFQQSTPQL